MLLNCHLVPHWMDELEYLCDDLSSEATSPEFRLWITSRPHTKFSISTLQLGVKVALEVLDPMHSQRRIFVTVTLVICLLPIFLSSL